LLLARGTTRQREVALRASLGAFVAVRSSRILERKQWLLALIGGALGTALGLAMIKAFILVMPRKPLPSEADVRLSVRSCFHNRRHNDRGAYSSDVRRLASVVRSI